MFADDRIVFIESPKESMDNFWELISEFGKIAKYKISKQKSVIFLYDSNERWKIKKNLMILFTVVSTNTEYLRINLKNNMEGFWTENYEVLERF